LSSLRKLLTDTAVYGITNIVGRFLNFLLVPFYTRLFLPEDFAIFTELYVYIAFLLVVLTYGMETGFFRFYEKSTNKQEVFYTSFYSVFILNAIALALFSIFAENIALLLNLNHNQHLIWLFMLIVFFDAVSAIPYAKLRADNKAYFFAGVKILNISLNILFNVIFFFVFPRLNSSLLEVFSTPNVAFIFIANFLASLVCFLILLTSQIRKFEFNYQLHQKIIKYVWPLIFVGMAGVANETIDRILIKILIPGEEGMKLMGIYAACYKIPVFLTIAIQAYRFAAEPFFFKIANTPDAKQKFRLSMYLFVVFILSAILIIQFYLPYFLLFIGLEYRSGAYIIPYILYANLFLGIYYNLSIWYKMTDQTKLGSIIAILGAVLTVILNYILIPVFEIKGAAIATLMVYFLMVIASYFMGKKYYFIPYDTGKLSFLIVLSIIFIYLNTIFQNTSLFASILPVVFLILFLYVSIKIHLELKSSFKKVKLLDIIF
jgi:O-antigen/teichoic acid export membrane protein